MPFEESEQMYFALRRKSANQFMLANQSMPGWAVGLSMFGSYISSISFLGNPATSFRGNWMFAGFTLMTPVGLLVGTNSKPRASRLPRHRRESRLRRYDGR